MNLAHLEPYIKTACELHRKMPVFFGYFNFSSETYRKSGGVQSNLEKLDAAGVRKSGCVCVKTVMPRIVSIASTNCRPTRKSHRRES